MIIVVTHIHCTYAEKPFSTTIAARGKLPLGTSFVLTTHVHNALFVDPFTTGSSMETSVHVSLY